MKQRFENRKSWLDFVDTFRNKGFKIESPDPEKYPVIATVHLNFDSEKVELSFGIIFVYIRDFENIEWEENKRIVEEKMMQRITAELVKNEQEIIHGC